MPSNSGACSPKPFPSPSIPGQKTVVALPQIFLPGSQLGKVMFSEPHAFWGGQLPQITEAIPEQGKAPRPGAQSSIYVLLTHPQHVGPLTHLFALVSRAAEPPGSSALFHFPREMPKCWSQARRGLPGRAPQLQGSLSRHAGEHQCPAGRNLSANFPSLKGARGLQDTG